MHSSNSGGPRDVTQSKEKLWDDSQPEGRLDLMNACSTMNI